MAQTTSKNSKTQSNNSDSAHIGQSNYGKATARPLHTLAFLLPLILIYEIGILTVDSIVQSQTRIVAFTWLQGLAQMIGMDESLAWAFPGFVVVIVLLCWHMASEFPWRIKFEWVLGMYLESALWSLPIFGINLLLGSSRFYAASATTTAIDSYMARVVTSIGAGIYEELVFRLILMGLLLMLFEDVFRLKKPVAGQIAVWTSAILFAAHHYIGFHDGHWLVLEYHTIKSFLMSFLFRTFSGIYFAFLFRRRGYGIIAGTHAAYNIILYSTIS